MCGSAGVGKSRLAREALHCAAANGRQVRWAVGTTSAQHIPLGAFESWAPAAGTDTLQVVRNVVGALTTTPNGTPVVIGVDDVNLLDDLSTFVLHRIVQRRAAKLVLTVRDRATIGAGTQEVWAAGAFERLDLQPLSRDETLRLLSATLGGEMHPDDATRLWRLTRGNVLYLRNIVEQDLTDGRLVNTHGWWHWTSDPVVSEGLLEIIESRMGPLPAEVGAVLDALAVGEPIELESLIRIAGAAAVEEADTRGLISVDTVDGRSRVRVAHPLYGQVRRDRAAPTRLRRIRGLVATELARSHSSDVRATVRRATLSLDSDLPPDPALLLTAARDAVWLADLGLADRLGDAAIRAGAGPEAYFIRAAAISWLGRAEEADALLVELAGQNLTDNDRATLVFLRATNMFWFVDPEGAKSFVDEAVHTMPSSQRGCIDAFLTQYWAATGRPEAARTASENLELDRLPAIAAAVAAAATTLSRGDAGRTGAAVTAANTGYGLTEKAHDAAQLRFGIADAHVGALVLAGRVDEACAVAQRLRRQAIDLPGPTAQFHSAQVAGRAALGAGRIDTACSVLEPTVEALLAAQEFHVGYLAQLFYGLALAMRGVADDAAATFAALETQRRWQCLDYACTLGQAWVAAARSATREAVAHACSAAESAQSNGQFAAEVMCRQTAAQFGDPSGAARLQVLATMVEGPRAGLAARLATALDIRDAQELASVSTEFERIGDLVAAADAAAHAAVVYRRRGSRGSSYSCATRAESLARQCGGLRTPALTDAIEPIPLTSREREIVMMIADGMTNRAIADRLILSVRTVETHVYRAMAKTGAGDRAQLASLLPVHRRKPAGPTQVQ